MKRQNSQSGFSVVEVVFAAGIITVSALVAAFAIQQTKKSALHIESQAKVISLADVVAARMVTPEACNASISPASGSFNRTLLDSTASIPLKVTLGTFDVTATTDVDNLKVESIALENVRLVRNTPGLYLGLVKMRVATDNAGLNKAKFRERIVAPLFVEFNDNAGQTYRHCFIKESPESLCKALGGTFNATVSPPCQLVVASVDCPGNSNYLIGFDISGTTVNPICKVPAGVCGLNQYMTGLPATLGDPPNCESF